MKWSYKTVHFELKREGLLGGSFLDETEVEEQLNQYGRSGWELTSVIEVQDGIIAFFKQPLDFGFSARREETTDHQDTIGQVIEEPYEAVAEEFVEAEEEYQIPDQAVPEADHYDEQIDHVEAHEFDDAEPDDHLISEDEEVEELLVDDERATFEDQESSDEQDEYTDQRGIGAIRIE